MGNKASFRTLAYATTYGAADAAGVVTKSTPKIRCDRSRTGTDNPKFKELIQQGLSATNYLYAYNQKVAWKLGRVNFTRFNTDDGKTYKGYSESMLTPTVIAPGIPGALLNDAKNAAAIGIRQRIGKETTTISGGVILGELRETIHMIRHPAESINRLLTKFVRDRELNLKRAQKLRVRNAKLKSRKRMPIPGYTVKNGNLRETSDTIAKSWLELVFGLDPFMSDIASILEAALPVYSEPKIKRLQFTAQADSSTSEASVTMPSGSSIEVPTFTEVTDEVSCRYVVGYKVEIQGVQSGWRKVIEQSGFNLREIIPTIWELLPWSFLIDYVSNIGDVIAANAVSLSNVAWSYLVTRRKSKRVISALCSKAKVASWDFRAKFVNGNDYLSSSSIVEVKREAASIPFGELRFSLPDRKRQYQNMAALLWLQLKF
nr:MAG: hypothetical protein 1 [Leviviridae sp.]